MMIPTIHTNGTSREALLNQVIDAGQAAQALLRALDEMSPHDRDYYPQGPEAGKQARREHATRIERVRSVLVELQALAEAIAD